MIIESNALHFEFCAASPEKLFAHLSGGEKKVMTIVEVLNLTFIFVCKCQLTQKRG